MFSGFKNKNGFTLVEIMISLTILGILSVGLYVGLQPYMMRSRDTKRVTDIQNYMTNIILTYRSNFDAFPSNYGSGGNANALGYCLSEMTTRPWNITIDHAHVMRREGYFSTFQNETSHAPVDPMRQVTYPTLCSMTGSYVYSQFKYGVSSQFSLIAARLEIRNSANYGTGADLINSGKMQDLFFAKKANIPISAPDQLFIVTAVNE